MLLKGESISDDIREFHKGETYSKTRKKYGKDKANRQAIAVAYSSKRKNNRSRGRSR